MATYQDMWDTRKVTEDIDNTLAVTWEMMGEKGIDDPETELTDEDKTAIMENLKSVIPELQSFLDDLTGQTPTEPAKDDDITDGGFISANSLDAVAVPIETLQGNVVGENTTDDCVRIVLHIPAAHLSAPQRAKLEKDVVQEAAIYSKMWMDALEYGGESFVMNDKVEPQNIEVEYEEEGIDTEEDELPPEEVIGDIVQKWRDTYETMRPDYKDNYDELDMAVFECLIEDGYIMPGHHYDVEVETVETLRGDTTSFVTGPKGSRTVKSKKESK